MRQFLGRASVLCNAAPAPNGFIHLLDVDMRADVPAQNAPASDGMYVSGIGQQDGYIEVLASISGAGQAVNTFPVMCIVTMTPGNFGLNGDFQGVHPSTLELQEMLVSGAQYAEDGTTAAAACPTFGRFFPRGRVNRFNFQVVAGSGGLGNFNLNAEFWQVVGDGR